MGQNLLGVFRFAADHMLKLADEYFLEPRAQDAMIAAIKILFIRDCACPGILRPFEAPPPRGQK